MDIDLSSRARRTPHDGRRAAHDLAGRAVHIRLLPATDKVLEAIDAAREGAVQSDSRQVSTAVAQTSTPQLRKTVLLRFWDQLAAATTVLQRALDAAGTPSVDNGAKIVSTVHAAFARLPAGIAKLRSETASLPTDSRADFSRAVKPLIQSITPTLDGAVSNLHGLTSGPLDAAAHRSQACSKAGIF